MKNFKITKEQIEEIWKDVVGYEKLYQISNLGRVKSLKRSREIILSLSISKHGYSRVSLYNANGMKTTRVSALVAISFLNHRMDGTNKIVVDHINNIKTDDRLVNLQLISNRDNCSKDVKNKTSRFTGVYLDSKNNKWRASIKINGLMKNLGRYTEETDAFEAYKKALEIHKEKAFKLQYEIGKWYRNSIGLFCVTAIEKDKVYAYGFCREEWSDVSSFPIRKYIEEDVLACEEEIENALIAEAKKRGFKEGVFIKREGINKDAIDLSKPIDSFIYRIRNNGLDSKNCSGWIFKDGKWAEIIEQKQPLFKSIDGVDVYENDTVFCVLKGTCASREIQIRKGYDNSPNDLWVGYFSTQEKADEYALMNKECLSLNDILNAWGGNDFLQNTADYKQSPLFNNFKKAVEAKQNPKSKGVLPQEQINNIETFCTEVKYTLKK